MVEFTNNKKLNSILIAGRELFWKHGFKRVTIEEICQKATVSKMTYYKFFSNKLELARHVFDIEAEKGAAQFRAIIADKIPPAEKIKKMIDMKMKGTYEISREFLMDFYEDPGLGLKDHIEETTKKLWSEIIQDFRKGQSEGVFRKDIKPELILYFSLKMMEFINDAELAKLYDGPMEMIKELAGFFVYGIAPTRE